MTSYEVYTDGSCIGNPGYGGYGVVIVNRDDMTEVTLRGNSRGEAVTNNQMEMRAVIVGLEYLPPGSTVFLFSDSLYIINGFNKKWYVKWIANDWTRRVGGSRVPVLNVEIWKRLLELKDLHSTITWKWVKAHSGNRLNERCDLIAKEEADKSKRTQMFLS